jgi:subtilisin family serine protease
LTIAVAEKTSVLIRTLPLALILLVLLPQAAAADTSTRIIVQREPGLSAAERADIRKDADVRFTSALPVADTEVVTAARRDLAGALRDLNRDPDVRWAMIEPTLRAFDVDPGFGDQWALNNTGQTGGTPDADLDGLQAWALGTGAGQTVAVIDSGADLDHPDLDANLQPGVDYVEPSTPPEDTSGHGTHVSGIIAAEYGNGIGVAGLAHGAKVVPLRVMSGFNGSLQRILDAFEYAGSSGARVANASLGTVPITDAEDAAQIRDLFNAVMARHPDTLYVVAAGNSANNNDARPVFPCNATAANLVCVAASDDNDAMTEFSNYGQQSVDVLAPGDEIVSTWKGDAYADNSGTSMAAPQVSAIAALVLSAAPSLPTAALKEAIFETGEVPVGPDLTLTHRRVNALAALEWLGVDEDGDGAVNGTDNCWRSMDTGDPDGDGVGGTCDLTPRGVDADGDGKPALDDSCPSVYGTLANGCPVPPPPPNTDGDGFIDAADACPTERAQTRNGCPLPALTALSGKVTKRGSRRYVTVRASTTRAAVVRILVQRKKGSKWVKVKKRTLATRGNRIALKVPRLKRGRHRIVVAVYSNAGSGTSATRYFRVR